MRAGDTTNKKATQRTALRIILSPFEAILQILDRLVHALFELLARLHLVHQLPEVRVGEFVFVSPRDAASLLVLLDLDACPSALEEPARLAEPEYSVFHDLAGLGVGLALHPL